MPVFERTGGPGGGGVGLSPAACVEYADGDVGPFPCEAALSLRGNVWERDEPGAVARLPNSSTLPAGARLGNVVTDEVEGCELWFGLFFDRLKNEKWDIVRECVGGGSADAGPCAGVGPGLLVVLNMFGCEGAGDCEDSAV